MAFTIDQRLSVDPKPAPVPGDIALRFSAHASAENTTVDILYSIGARWNVCFSTPAGPTKSLLHQATLGTQSCAVTQQARLVRCDGEAGALVRVTAAITEVSTGQTSRTACTIVPS